MADGSPRRLGLGAPNEERFGFVQAVVVPSAPRGQVLVSGQVGKDNTTGAMRPASSFASHVRNALTNGDEALDLTGARPAALACTAFVPRLEHLGGEALDALHEAAGQRAAITVVGIAALSSPDYHIEVSAIAPVEEESMTATSIIPWPGGAPVGAVGAAAGVAIGGVVHLAGHLAWNPDGSLTTGTVAEQLSACYAAIDRTLSSAGLTGTALVAEHVFVVAGADEVLDFVAICDAHRTATTGRRPASTLVPVASLAVPGALACVAAIAAGAPA